MNEGHLLLALWSDGLRFFMDFCLSLSFIRFVLYDSRIANAEEPVNSMAIRVFPFFFPSFPKKCLFLQSDFKIRAL